jgi:hypothetical protein
MSPTHLTTTTTTTTPSDHHMQATQISRMNNSMMWTHGMKFHTPSPSDTGKFALHGRQELKLFPEIDSETVSPFFGLCCPSGKLLEELQNPMLEMEWVIDGNRAMDSLDRVQRQMISLHAEERTNEKLDLLDGKLRVHIRGKAVAKILSEPCESSSQKHGKPNVDSQKIMMPAPERHTAEVQDHVPRRPSAVKIVMDKPAALDYIARPYDNVVEMVANIASAWRMRELVVGSGDSDPTPKEHLCPPSKITSASGTSPGKHAPSHSMIAQMEIVWEALGCSTEDILGFCMKYACPKHARSIQNAVRLWQNAKLKLEAWARCAREHGSGVDTFHLHGDNFLMLLKDHLRNQCELLQGANQEPVWHAAQVVLACCALFEGTGGDILTWEGKPPALCTAFHYTLMGVDPPPLSF